ncbi:helix-turn-helix domain-containing protein [Amycolatopsis sp. lyj-23]|uniref:nSTAND1 domain-containing NTPase n=1 Tax=Amycolatopsis sp. lyj-23 TaxID=2789283 RepID=UPI003979A6FA
MEPDPELNFASQLRKLRALRGLSLAELSRLTHYSKGYLSNIENGRKPATADLARRLDEVLACDGALIAIVEAGDTSACPYLGLSAFGAGDAGRFFGRGRISAALTSRVAAGLDHGLPLVVFGASGAGKSSLLHAALIPALARGVLPVAGAAKWPVLVMTPTASPARALGEGAAKVLGTSASGLRDSLAVHGWTDALRTALGPANSRLVIVVDQFEEVFALCEDEGERRQFIAALCARPDGESAVQLVVLGVRADFYGRCLAYPELLDAVQHNQFVIEAMSEAELVEAITGPAREAGVDLEPGLVEILLRDLGFPRSAGEPGTLPLLSHALLTTWQQREGDRLTVAGYELTGGIRGAVAATAERVYTSLDDDGRRAARRLLLRLVHVGEDEDTRRRADLDGLLGDGPEREPNLVALRALVAARLLTLDRQTVEITHEALLRAWPRLRAWTETDRTGLRAHQRFSEAAEVWRRHGRPVDLLQRGAPLAGAKEWAAEHPDRLTAFEREYLQAGEREEQRGTRRLRRLVAGLAVLSLLAVAAAGWAWVAEHREHRQRDLALAEKVVAETPALHASNPGLAVQLSLAAARLAPGAETLSGLLSAVASPHFTRLDHSDTVTSAVFSPDGHTLATTDDDHEVRVWDAASPAEPRVLAGHTGVVTSSAFSPDGRTLATGSEDGTVSLWHFGGTPARTVLRLGSPVRSVAFGPDGHTLATGGDDRVARLWDVSGPGPQPSGTMPGHTGSVNAIAFSADRHTLATVGGTVRLWDVTDRPRPRPLAELGQAVDTAAFSPDGKTLATGGGDHLTRLWDVGTPGHPAALGVLATHTDKVNSVAFSPDGRTLATASDDRTAVLWDVTDPGNPATLSVLAGHTEAVTTVVFGPDGHTLATGSDDNSARLWRLPVPEFTGHTDRVLTLAFAPDGRVLASAGLDRTIRLWDTAAPGDPHALATISAPERLRALAFRPNGRLLAVAGAEGGVTLWDLGDPRRPRASGKLAGSSERVRALAFSPDGRTLLTGGDDHTARLWDVTDPAKPAALGRLDGHTDRVMTVAFGADGHTVATGSYDRTARLWDTTDPTRPRALATLADHTHVVRSVAFSPDGHTLATGAWDHTTKLWDVADPAHPRDVATLSGHSAPVNAVVFSPDGRTLATAGDDGDVRLWTVGDPAKPGVRAILTGHTDLVYALAFHPDGHTLISAGRDRIIRRWETDADRAARLACDLAGTRVTPAQWSAAFGDSAYDPPCP